MLINVVLCVLAVSFVAIFEQSKVHGAVRKVNVPLAAPESGDFLLSDLVERQSESISLASAHIHRYDKKEAPLVLPLTLSFCFVLALTFILFCASFDPFVLFRAPLLPLALFCAHLDRFAAFRARPVPLTFP